ncbi:hypothetical protein P2G88_01850 [Aliiglaciecola sp. CAU 1673]|uniref:hypothetical protein n=1 Tax=Aliiglaciecola sp. CAU 1673 TaxID=3032595 RepID=UPI0023D9F14F|nr:hypothetical protein [Aliiglaciecola sp. CAU 1673]MDF2176996.1 hypothetical protein [Aliiglaciecola sp. CAU 1673]
MKYVLMAAAISLLHISCSEATEVDAYDNFEGKLIELRSGVGLHTLALKLDTKRPSSCEDARNEFFIIPSSNTTAIMIAAGASKRDVLRGRAFLDASSKDCMVERIIRIPQ